MSQDNRQYHFRPANYPYRPTAEDLDSKKGSAGDESPLAADRRQRPAAPAPEPRTPQAPAPEASTVTWPAAAPTPQPAAPQPAAPQPSSSSAPEPASPNSRTFWDHASASSQSRPPVTPVVEPEAPRTQPDQHHDEHPSAFAAEPVTASSSARAVAPTPVVAPVAALDSASAPTPSAPADTASTGAGPVSTPQHDAAGAPNGAGPGGPVTPVPVPAPGGPGHPGGRHFLSRLLIGLLVVLALLVGLAIGSFALNNPTVRTTPGPTNTVTATVTPPAQTVTAPPATVTLTPSAAQTSASYGSTGTATSTQATSTQSETTTGTVVAGQSCSSFGDVAYSADGARLTCTRPTVQDYLRWMQIS